MKPRMWAPHGNVAMTIAMAATAIVPMLVAHALFGRSAGAAVPFALSSIPTAVVVGSFALADRRSPLVGAAAASLGYLTWIASKASLASATAMDATDALAYLFVCLQGVPVAVLGAAAFWLADALIRDALARTTKAAVQVPYR